MINLFNSSEAKVMEAEVASEGRAAAGNSVVKRGRGRPKGTKKLSTLENQKKALEIQISKYEKRIHAYSQQITDINADIDEFVVTPKAA